MGAALTNTKNFPTKHRAKIVGLLDIMYGGSPLLFSLAYYYIFTEGQPSDPQSQDVGGFMIMYVIGHGIASVLCIFLLRIYPHKKTVKLKLKKIDPGNEEGNRFAEDRSKKRLDGHMPHDSVLMHESDELSDDENPLSNADSSCLLNKKPKPKLVTGIKSYWTSRCSMFWKVIKDYLWTTFRIIVTKDFQLILWTFSCNVAVATMINNNIVVILKFNGLADYQTTCTVILSAIRMPVGFGCGILSDVLQDKIPRASLFILAGVLNLISHSLCIFFLDSLGVLLSICVMTGTALGICWFMGLTLASEMFCTEYLGRIWGFCLLGQAILVSFVQWIFGSVYDNHSTSEFGDCNGNECFRTTSIVTASMCIIPIITSIALTVRSYKYRMS